MRAPGLKQRWIERYLRESGRIWRHLPEGVRGSRTGQAYGRHLHALVLRHASRQQYFGTFFLRNRAELELMRRLVRQKPRGAVLEITVLACSKGAEVYSMAWAIRSARPDLALRIHAVDISREIVDFAAQATYAWKSAAAVASTGNNSPAARDAVAWNSARDQNAPLFERVSAAEMEAMFEIEGDHARVRPWLRQGISWHCADAFDPALARLLGPQDMVLANRFLCHMNPTTAELCLRSVARLVKPGGHLFVSGIDLDVREKVAQSMGWQPVTEMIREVHEGNISIRKGWPLEYWGLEPFRRDCPDWQVRFASVFRIGEPELRLARPAQHPEPAAGQIRAS